MQSKSGSKLIPVVVVIVLLMIACNFPTTSQNPADIPPTDAPPPGQVSVPPADTTAPVVETAVPEPTAEPVVEPTPTVVHVMLPALPAGDGRIIYDVTSKDTAPENRAPYGDSYQINRLERPFNQEMLYNPDLDIVTFNLTKDQEWYYVSIQLVGFDPNNTAGIQYGLEIDLDRDGFGDYIITANPPYTPAWTADYVRVYMDENNNTGGISGSKSDAPFPGDGYEKLIFNGGFGDDPDLAWVRINAGRRATVQFAFKKSLAGDQFMLGVLADAGFRDVTMLDYVDRFTREEAGSPVRDNKDYPLKALFSVDNTCREAFGFTPNGYEPQLCPHDEPTPQPHDTPDVCLPPPYCHGLWYDWDPVNCICIVTPW